MQTTLVYVVEKLSLLRGLKLRVIFFSQAGYILFLWADCQFVPRNRRGSYRRLHGYVLW